MIQSSKIRGAGAQFSKRVDETESELKTWDAIRARRKVRSSRPDQVPDTDLDRIAEAGWRSPPARNQQHWDFVIVTDRNQLEGLSTLWRGAGRIGSAPAAIAFIGCPRPALRPVVKPDRRPFGEVVHRGRW